MYHEKVMETAAKLYVILILQASLAQPSDPNYSYSKSGPKSNTQNASTLAKVQYHPVKR